MIAIINTFKTIRSDRLAQTFCIKSDGSVSFYFLWAAQLSMPHTGPTCFDYDTLSIHPLMNLLFVHGS